MADEKEEENSPKSLSGLPFSASASNAPSSPKPAKKKNLTTKKIQDTLNYLRDALASGDALDHAIAGGCSTCGSSKHATIRCDRKETQPAYMMSGALLTGSDTPSSVLGTAIGRTASDSSADGVRDGPDWPPDKGKGRAVRRYSA